MFLKKRRREHICPKPFFPLSKRELCLHFLWLVAVFPEESVRMAEEPRSGLRSNVEPVPSELRAVDRDRSSLPTRRRSTLEDGNFIAIRMVRQRISACLEGSGHLTFLRESYEEIGRKFFSFVVF